MPERKRFFLIEAFPNPKYQVLPSILGIPPIWVNPIYRLTQNIELLDVLQSWAYTRLCSPSASVAINTVTRVSAGEIFFLASGQQAFNEYLCLKINNYNLAFLLQKYSGDFWVIRWIIGELENTSVGEPENIWVGELENRRTSELENWRTGEHLSWRNGDQLHFQAWNLSRKSQSWFV